MSRLPRVAALAVLVAALCCGVPAQASVMPTARLEIARVFNAQSESLFAALLSPPREMSMLSDALFNIAIPSELAIRDVAQLLPVRAPSFSVPHVNLQGVIPIRTYTAPAVTAYTVPQIAPEPIDAASPIPLSDQPPPVVKPIALTTAPQVRFGSYAPYAPSVKALSADARIPVRVGGVHFSGLVSASQGQTTHTDAVAAVRLCGTVDEASACPYLHESTARTLVAGTDFTVRTGDRNVSLQLSGSVEHLSNGDAGIFPYVPLDPEESFDASRLNSAVPENGMLQYPGLTALVKHAVDARVAVPITQRVTLGLQYDTSHYQGDYGTGATSELVQGLNARKDTYLGNVTYQLPNTNSAVTLSARLYRYQDGLAQNFNLTQTRTDLNFTVKF